MKRCFDLARFGAKNTQPNPMVGAVLVYEDRIIGEGFHPAAGQSHAEVVAVGSVVDKDKDLISKSTLYVSLEPCCFHGRTPACTNLILENKIPRVVISCLDLSPEVAGKGVKILRDKGVEVLTGVLEEEGKNLARIRNTFASRKKPYTIIKYARSADGFMGVPGKQFWLTDGLSKRLVHKWRTESSAILVGSNTVLIDDPALTSRLHPGPNPVRILLDRRGRIQYPQKKIFDSLAPTWVVTSRPDAFMKVKTDRIIDINNREEQLWQLLFEAMYEVGLSSLLIEGGGLVLKDAIEKNIWDEARIFTAPILLKNGLPSPQLHHAKAIFTDQILKDQLQIFYNS
ncbi:MAG: bifunctional diaminohydroxyphosphoribosylaminopyrimidine deaminase/5-amino-6-(5-phosphoribosylamino)uracil reductase RibD [Bacteroidetes bacterium]|nr:bifunctional diaminohydroxyphosphoribosylaminopyrimidine deaminase/5-amino-6-(5-phosphoribosylamino)uracil reductase RibD [Bacteroidota bacterium]